MTENNKRFDYNKAYEYSIKYAQSESLDPESKLRIKNDERFRFDFNSIDISFNCNDSVLIVRACIERESDPKRDDFLAIMNDLNIRYKDELADGYLEYDSTALEVDLFKPNRLNIRYDFYNSEIEIKDFIKKVDALLTAAKKWRNKYYLSIYEELNKTNASNK